MFRYSIIIFLTGIISLPAAAQQVLTESEAVAKALTNNKNIQAASLQVKQQQQLSLQLTCGIPISFGKAQRANSIQAVSHNLLNFLPCTVINIACKNSKLEWRKKKNN
jgi:hypothetical protein